MLRTLRVALAALALGAFSLAHAAPERSVSIGLQAAITSIDPHYHNLSPNNSMLIHVFEPLIARDPNQKLVPALATSWKAIDDLTWEFKLRKNVKFHDGSPFTADDVVFTLNRVPNVPNSPSSFATFTKPIVDVKVIDPHTIVFKTASPHVLLPSDLASVLIVSKLNGEKATTADYNSGKAAIGTGPYKFVEYIQNQHVLLKANYGYWGGEQPWDKVTFKILSNPAARVAALLSKDVQMIETVPTSDIAKFSKDASYGLADKVSNRVIYVHLWQWSDKSPPFVTAKDGKPLDKNPFKDARVRKALSMAINRDAISERIMEKKSVPAAQLLADNFYGTSKKLKPQKYDPEGAKKLLAEAGYPNGFEAILRVSPQYAYTVRTGEVLTDQLQKIGVKIKIEQIEWSQWLSRVWKDAEYDLTIIGHAEAWDIGNYANPKYYYRYDNADFQKLFKESETTVDDRARRALYAKMQRKLVEDAPVVWLYIHPRLAVTKKGLQGIWKDLPLLANDLSEVAWAK